MDKVDPEVQKYIDVLKGGRVKGRFGKNLIIIDGGEQSIEERTKDDISPPLNYNREYSEPLKKPKQTNLNKKQGQTRTRVDPELMRELLRS